MVRNQEMTDNVWRLEYVTVGKEELLAEEEISIYPNPASVFVMINGKNIEEITLHNLHDELVKNSRTVSKRNKVDLTELPVGIYVITIKSNTNYLTKKLVKF